MKENREFPNTLLITRIPYNYPYGTGIQLAPVIEQYGQRIAWYSMREPVKTIDKPLPELLDYADGNFLTRPTRLRKLRSLFNHTVWAMKMGLDAAKMGRKHQVKLVIAYVHPPVLLAAFTASLILRAPLAIVIYDDPLALLDNNPHDVWFRPVAKWFLPILMKKARSHAVIGDAMAEYYRQTYGIKASTLIHGSENYLEQNVYNENQTHFTIGLIGKYWPAYEHEWQILIDAVHLLNERFPSKTFRILRIGELDPERFDTQFVDQTGYLDDEAFSQALAKFDIGFVSLPFSDKTIFAYTSFPSRIMTLIQSQRPIIAFGPEKSTPVTFVNQYGCGVSCSEASKEALADTFCQLLFEQGRYQTAQMKLSQMKQQFSKEQFFKNFMSFVNRAL